MKLVKFILILLVVMANVTGLEAKKAAKKQVSVVDTLSIEAQQQFKYYFYPAVEAFLNRQYDKATALFLFCEELNPKDATTKMYIGMIYKAIGQTAMALDHFRLAYELNPNEYWYIYARVLLEQKQGDVALQIAEKQHVAQPKDLTVITFLQQLYLNINNIEKATLLQKEVDGIMGGMSSYSVQKKIQILRQAQRNADAAKLLDMYLEENPDDTRMLNMRGDMYWENGDEINALRCYEKTNSWANIANRYMDSMRYVEARAMWERQVEQTPGDQQAWIKLYLCMQEDTTVTLKEKKRVILRGLEEIENVQWDYYLVSILLEEEKIDSAIVVARAGRNIEGDAKYRVTLGIHLGDMYVQKAQYDSAYAAYEWVLALDPDNVYVLNNYAYTLAEHGNDLKKAEDMSQKAITKEPNNPIYLDTYAWIMHLKKQAVFAEHYISRALDLAQQENMGADVLKEIKEHYDIIFKRGTKK